MSETAEEQEGGGVGVFAEEEAQRKQLKKQAGKNKISQAVDQAKRHIINGQIDEANRLVYDKMTSTIKDKTFMEDSIELLPAYFVLAEANICHGGSRLKKAEEFLIAAYWNLLKYTSEETEKGGGSDDTLVSKQEIEQYRANINKLFGRLFLAQNKPETQKKALEELSQGIFLECKEHGPESIYLCSSYYYMGELFRKEDSIQKARSFFAKIVSIWKKFITEKDMQNSQNPMYSTIDEYYYHEAIQHLSVIKNFFENEFGPDNILTAETCLAFGLVCLKTGDYGSCMENLQKALMVFQNQGPIINPKSREVENLLRLLDNMNN